MVENPVWQDEDDMKINIPQSKKTGKVSKKLIKLVNNYKNKDKETIGLDDIEEDLTLKYKEIKKDFINRKFYNWAEIKEEPEKVEGGLESLLAQSKSLLHQSPKKKEEKNQQKKFNHNYKSSNISNAYIVKQDLNQGYFHNSICSVFRFSPYNKNLSFSAGLDKKLNIFLIENEENANDLVLNYNSNENESSVGHVRTTKLQQSVNTKDMPIYSAGFLKKNEILISGRRKHYFSYDLEREKLTRLVFNTSFLKTEIKSLERCYMSPSSYCFSTLEGAVFVFDANSKQFKTNFKINGSVSSVCFDSLDENTIYCSSNQGEIFLFDIRRNSTCIGKIEDDGSFNTISMDVDSTGKYLATGSHSGIVNLYNLNDVKQKKEVEPIKVRNNKLLIII